ncbi:MAG: sulfur carrier protein ThiS [Bacteroidetes bacterium]|nr:sulfur carrier protein ThiS [Bacteroidota bacterium]
MKITLNNSPEDIERNEISISELLVLKNFVFKMLVIKLNDKVIKKPDYATTFIKDGDTVMVLHLVSGG